MRRCARCDRTLLAALACWSRSNKPAQTTIQQTATATTATPTQRVSSVPLPGAGSDGVGMDYAALQPHTSAVWVPPSTAHRERRRHRGRDAQGHRVHRLLDQGEGAQRPGPSHGAELRGARRRRRVRRQPRRSVGVRAVDERTLPRAASATASTPAPTGDPLRAVDARGGGDHAARQADPHPRRWQAGGRPRKHEVRRRAPEGFAVDVKRGRYYTNMEDHDETSRSTIKSHQDGRDACPAARTARRPARRPRGWPAVRRGTAKASRR